MKIIQESMELSTKGFTDIVDITAEVQEMVEKAGLSEGHVIVFIPGATAGVTTIEYEPGLLKDLPEALEKVAPMGKTYHHDDTWGDGNGFSHVRAALTGPSLTVPFSKGRLTLGTWQQIIIMDFDNRSRTRRVAVQLVGE